MTTETPTAPAEIDWSILTEEDLATAYMTCRERKEKAEAAADRAESVMKQIKQEMLSRMATTGQTGWKVEGVATVTRTLKKNFSCADWTRFLPWLLEQSAKAQATGRDPLDAFSFLHRRVSNTAIQEYMDAHDGTPPPAINAMQEYDVSIRKAT